MRTATLARLTSATAFAALLVAAPATASAQNSGAGSLPSDSLGFGSSFAGSAADSVGGSLARAGSAGLATAIAGHCVALDPGYGSIGGNPLVVEVASKEGTPGTATARLEGGTWWGSTQGTLAWKNETTGATGSTDFGPFGGDANIQTLDLETGTGHVTWSISGATQEGMALSIGLPLGLLGSTAPLITNPYSTCGGAADIA